MRMAQLGVMIDSSGAKKGAQETTQALDSIGTSAKRTVGSLGEVGAASTRAVAGMTAVTAKGREMAASQTTLATATQGATRGVVAESAALQDLLAQSAAAKAQRQAAGIPQGLLRLAVGLEDVEDLKADLRRGLATLA